MQPQALDLFGEPVRSFDRDALGFLIDFAKQHKGEAFGSEDVTLAAQHAGIAPTDLRAWGHVFTQAARDGHIRRDPTHVYQRSMGNGSASIGWRAC